MFSSVYNHISVRATKIEARALPTVIQGIWVSNTGTATAFLKLFNKLAANVSIGSTVPDITIPIPGGASADVTGVLGVPGAGCLFNTGLTIAATTGIAETDTGAPGANEVIVNIFYR